MDPTYPFILSDVLMCLVGFLSHGNTAVLCSTCKELWTRYTGGDEPFALYLQALCARYAKGCMTTRQFSGSENVREHQSWLRISYDMPDHWPRSSSDALQPPQPLLHRLPREKRKTPRLKPR